MITDLSSPCIFIRLVHVSGLVNGLIIANKCTNNFLAPGRNKQSRRH